MSWSKLEISSSSIRWCKGSKDWDIYKKSQTRESSDFFIERNEQKLVGVSTCISLGYLDEFSPNHPPAHSFLPVSQYFYDEFHESTLHGVTLICIFVIYRHSADIFASIGMWDDLEVDYQEEGGGGV